MSGAVAVFERSEKKNFHFSAKQGEKRRKKKRNEREREREKEQSSRIEETTKESSIKSTESLNE